jgi:hypothetical protein
VSEPHEIRIDAALGRQLLGGNNQPIGRIEEFRTERRGDTEVVTEVVIGLLGIFERMHVTAHLLFGAERRGCVAKWDQIDFSEPKKPRLKVSIDELDDL